MQRIALTTVSALIALALAPTPADAAEGPDDDDGDRRSWTAKAELGLAVTSGNSTSETLNGRFEFLREEDRWFYGLNASMLRAKADDALSANRFELGLRLGYDFNDRSYLAGSLRHEADDFAAFEHQLVAAASLGYRFIDSERTTLVGEIGPGLRRVQPIDALVGTPPVATPAGPRTDTIARGSLDYRHQVTATTALTNRLLAESGGSVTFLRNDFGVTVRMSERLALGAGYQLRHTTEVPAGVEKTDRLLTTHLVVGF